MGEVIKRGRNRRANVDFNIPLGKKHHRVDGLNKVSNVDEVASVHTMHGEVESMTTEGGVDEVGDGAFGLARAVDGCRADNGVRFNHRAFPPSFLDESFHVKLWKGRSDKEEKKKKEEEK